MFYNIYPYLKNLLKQKGKLNSLNTEINGKTGYTQSSDQTTKWTTWKGENNQ